MNFKTYIELVEHLELAKHIEGGYYRETYRSDQQIPTSRGLRNKATVIYYCLPSNDFSVWHKLVDATETFHYHFGDCSQIYRIEQGKISSEILGPNPLGKQVIEMPPNTWFAIRPCGINNEANYSLMSCVVEPGFEFCDLVIADESLLDNLDKDQYKIAESLLKRVYA